MIFAFLYFLIGSAVAYFMQPQIRYIAERMTSYVWLQAVIKILMDAILSMTWIIGAPVLISLKLYLQGKENEED